MITNSDDIKLKPYHRTLLKRLAQEKGISPSDVLTAAVDDFVKKNYLPPDGNGDFSKSRDDKNEDSILNVAGCLSGAPISAEEIGEELYGD